MLSLRATMWLIVGSLLPALAGGCAGEPSTNVMPAPDCDPLTQTGCDAGEKCSTRFGPDGDDSDATTECVTAGTVGTGEACELVADGESRIDNCAAGLVCGPDAVCTSICANRVRGSCGDEGTCIAINGLFEDVPGRAAGACVNQCDVLDPEGSCESGEGCYTFLMTGEPLCVTPASGAETLGFMDECAPQSSPGVCFVNSAPIGAIAFLDLDYEAQDTPRITPYCRAVSTHSTSADPSSTSRGDDSDPLLYCGPTSRMPAANTQCRHLQSLYSNEELDFIAPGIGVCVPTTTSNPAGQGYNDSVTFDVEAWAANPRTALNPDGVPYCPGCLTRDEFRDALFGTGREQALQDVAPRATRAQMRAIRRDMSRLDVSQR